MDPVGLALENYDHSGRWRDTDNGAVIDASSAMIDGTALNGPADLRAALLARSDTFIRTLSGKLLSYALGRELDWHDGPAVRAIVRGAEPADYSFNALVQNIVASQAFRMRAATGAVHTASTRP
jgi:hypothetical protein